MRASSLPSTSLRLLIVGAVTIALLATMFVAVPAKAEAAGMETPAAQEIVLPMAPADEGGDGLAQAGASEWIPFAVALGPATVLIAALLLLTFRIDAGESDED